jgi:phosphoenolpyruvate carboxykinase (GTP)
MGPIGSPFAKVGVELTDSVYVVLNQRIMTRMGNQALDMLGDSDDFNRGLHCTLDLDPEKRFICHFPQDNTIWSCGSGYGGNVLLGKKCLALRIGSYLGQKEGWLAEHMLILGIESPEGQTSYVAAAFPSACGKTNFAMMIPPRRFDGWKIWTVGDDIAWMRVGTDGRLYAVNPENGYFGVAPGTSMKSNPNAMKTIQRDTIFTNVARTLDGDVWWEEHGRRSARRAHRLAGAPLEEGLHREGRAPQLALHRAGQQQPVPEPRVQQPRGRAHQRHHLRRAPRHHHPARAAELQLGARRVPGRHAGLRDHRGRHRQGGRPAPRPHGHAALLWVQHGRLLRALAQMRHDIESPPKLFLVNWFRKDDNGKFLWPGFGENMRVLKWVLDRAHGRIGGRETPIGWVPREGDIDLSGLDLDPERFDQATAVSTDEWIADIEAQQEFFDKIGDSMPKSLVKQRELLLESLRTAPREVLRRRRARFPRALRRPRATPSARARGDVTRPPLRGERSRFVRMCFAR